MVMSEGGERWWFEMRRVLRTEDHAGRCIKSIR